MSGVPSRKRLWLTVFLVAVIGACAGRVARVFLEYRHELARAEGGDVKGASEIREQGRDYSILPLAADKLPPEKIERCAAELKRHAVDYRVVEGKLLAESAKIPLAMDALQAAGLGDDARHFSFREITADPEKEPERHALQERLATQNMLANLITLLADDIADAKVVIDPEAKAARVKLSRKGATAAQGGRPAPGGGPVAPALAAEIERHVRAVAGDVAVTIE